MQVDKSEIRNDCKSRAIGGQVDESEKLKNQGASLMFRKVGKSRVLFSLVAGTIHVYC